ncbi:hypothetical protein HZH68_003824 [Vespula germanica]|uniref:Uncharacterized protein n=1 Tax=Vespula germanica TaxID=30212 RepID=A0A834NJ83_VESGE|nr:hypothetical protein HZH68_003824 [Vespula germanica]
MRHRQDSRTFTATPVDAPPWLEKNAGSRQARQLGRSGGSKSNPIGAQNVAHAHPGIEATEAQRQRRTSRRVPQCVWRTALFERNSREERRQKTEGDNNFLISLFVRRVSFAQSEAP